MEVDESTIFDESARCFVNDLPDEVIEYILSLLPPYKDLEQCMLVCKRWQKNVLNVIHHKKNSFNRSICNFSIKWENVTPAVYKSSTISKRYSHSACSYGNSMYVFGGCTCTSTTFNDLWRLDLSTRKWVRLLTMGTYPTPKACATIVYYNNSLVLFGGWTHPSPYPLHQQWRMFNELHIYDMETMRWSCIMSPTFGPPPMAGHSATIHGDTMVVFGGLHDTYGSSNDVWCFELLTDTWRKQQTSEPKPLARYGQSQIVLDTYHLIILGGCGGGPNMVLNDVWLLDMTKDIWIWHAIQVHNPQWAASHLWCHPACKIGNNVVVFSRNPMSTVPIFAYSKWSPAHPRAGAQSAQTETENLPSFRRNMDGCVGQQHIDRDVNVNGRRGSLTPRSSQNLETAGPSHQTGPRQSFSSNEIREDSVAINNQNRRCSHPSNADSGPSTSQDRMSHNLDSSNKRLEMSKKSYHNCGKSSADLPINEGSMAAFRDMVTDGYLGKQRERQLEVLRRMEERIRHISKNNSQPRREVSPPPMTSTIKLLPPKMAMFVMDISSVLTEHFVSWLPLKSVADGSPEDTILYTLVVGNGELIMFGGIQKDATSVTQQTQSSMNIANTVSNSLHFITAPFDII